MTDKLLDEIKEANEKRTQGAWFVEDGRVKVDHHIAFHTPSEIKDHIHTVAHANYCYGDGLFIALAPKMAKLCIEQAERIKELEAALQRCDDILGNMDDDANYCFSNDYANAVHFTKQALSQGGE